MNELVEIELASKVSELLSPQMDSLLSYYSRMVRIRAFEEALLEAFGRGELRGTTHTCIGQESIAVAAMEHVGPNDVVFSNHRCHGHFLAYGGEMKSLVAEIMGSPDGVCNGIGGSQHLHYRNFYSNGVQGGIVPVTAGIALAEKLAGHESIGIVFLGDGTLGEGVVYETFNMVGLWSLPVLFIIENNGMAQSTRQPQNLSGAISQRSSAFGIETATASGEDVIALSKEFQLAYEVVRKHRRPFCLIVKTVRLGPHSKGDDLRTAKELELLRQSDPIAKIALSIPQPARLHADKEARHEVEEAIESARTQARQKRKALSLLTDANLVPDGAFAEDGLYSAAPLLAVEHLREVHHQLMADKNTLLIGEDLLDPYGGAFKVTKGLSTLYPDRVLTTPISESAIVGFANGAALRGMRCIAEIMFGDFLTLCADQIVNHSTKFLRMYGDKRDLSLIVRAPMGAYRGYGPTHSQSLEKLFLGVPGLTVCAFSPVHDQHLMFRRMLELKSPCLYIENKVAYGLPMMSSANGRCGSFYVFSSRGFFPTIALSLRGFSSLADVAIAAYGGLVPMALQAASELFMEDELSVDVLVFSNLSAMTDHELQFALTRSNRFVTVEEGTRRSGWGAEMAAKLSELSGHCAIVERVGALDTIIPNSHEGELSVLPSVERIKIAIRKSLRYGSAN